MSDAPTGRRPRYARANVDRDRNPEGFVLELELGEGQWSTEWFPGAAAKAVAAARTRFPGCRIDHLYPLDWLEWLLVMEDERAAREDFEAIGLDWK